MLASAIIVAAGTSQRMGFDKLAAPISGIPLLAVTVSEFFSHQAFGQIILVAPEERLSLLSDLNLGTRLIRVDGGKTRQESVAKGLAAVSADSEWIAIHDAARPLTSAEDISSTLNKAREYGAASLARRVTETLKRSTPDNFVSSSLNRDDLWFMETPQIFSSSLIRRAYQYVAENGLSVTDETSAVEAIGEKVYLVPSTAPNPKITTPADLAAIF